MKKNRKTNQFIKSPQYRGGLTAMRKFIAANLKYPKSGLAEKISGSVYIRYEINNKGKVVDSSVISGLGPGFDEEAERVVRLLEFDVERVRKLRVTHHKKIRVWFRYMEEEVKEKEIPTKINYTIQPSASRGRKAEETKSKGGYSYIVKY